MTQPGQKSYESRVVAKATIGFDVNGNPYFLSSLGISGYTFTVDKIHLEPDMTGLLGPDTASTAAQLTFNAQGLEKINAPSQTLRCSPGTKPGEIILGYVTAGGGTVAWQNGNVYVVTVEWRIVELGPVWPTSS